MTLLLCPRRVRDVTAYLGLAPKRTGNTCCWSVIWYFDGEASAAGENIGDEGLDKDLGVMAPDCVAESSDLASSRVVLSDIGGGVTKVGLADFSIERRLSKDGIKRSATDVSRTPLCFSISLSLSGSSSKSTKFFGANACSLDMPETTRALGVIALSGENVGFRADGVAERERERCVCLFLDGLSVLDFLRLEAASAR